MKFVAFVLAYFAFWFLCVFLFGICPEAWRRGGFSRDLFK